MPQDQFRPEDRARLSSHAVLSFIDVVTDWQVEPRERLALAGYPEATSFQVWQDYALDGQILMLPEALLLRLSAVSGVGRVIASLLPQKGDRITWLRSPVRGPICRGLAPIEILSDPQDAPVLEFRSRLDDWSQLPWLRGASFARKSGVPPRRPTTSVEDLLASITGQPHKR